MLENSTQRLLPDALESLIDDNPFIRDTVKDCIIEKLKNYLKEEVSLVGKKGIFESLKKLFDLDNKAVEICFLAYVYKNYDPIASFFNGELSIFSHENCYIFAEMLEIDTQECLKIKNDLFAIGILTYTSMGSIGLMHEIEKRSS